MTHMFQDLPTAASAASAASHEESADVAMGSNTQKRERPETAEPEAEEDVEVVNPEPPQETQRENIPTEEVMCPGCGANLVTGPIVCPACNTNIAGTPKVKQSLISKRRELLKRLGYDHLNADTIERLGGQSKQFREGSGRGMRSPEGDFVETARKQVKRAIGLGYTSMADRYENDVTFIERMTEHGITLQDIQLRDIAGHGHLPMPPRTKTQVDYGIGLKTAHDMEFAKLMYIDEDISSITDSDRALNDRFDDPHWAVIWGRDLYSLKEFQELCERRHQRGKTTKLLTFTCVMEATETPTMRELHQSIDSSLPVAEQLVRNKRIQSEKAAERNEAKGRGKSSRALVAAPKTPPKAAPPQQDAPAAEPEMEVSPRANINQIGTFDVRQMPTAKYPPSVPKAASNAPPKAPPVMPSSTVPRAKARSTRDAREGAHGSRSSREPQDGDTWGHYTFWNGQWWTRERDGRWSTGSWRHGG